ncbi:MAG: hypothetical protein AAFO95_14110, partial [Cyanobacteria bacterium J06600_6]
SYRLFKFTCELRISRNHSSIVQRPKFISLEIKNILLALRIYQRLKKTSTLILLDACLLLSNIEL